MGGAIQRALFSAAATTTTTTTTTTANTVKNRVDWSQVLNRCAPNVRKTVLETRAYHEELRRQIGELKTAQPKIDWSYYRNELKNSQYTKAVDELEQAATAFFPKRIDLGPLLKDWEREKNKKIEESKLFIEEVENDITKLKEQLYRLSTAKPVDEMTVDDVYAIYPEMKEKFHRDLQQDNWSTDPTYDPQHDKETSQSNHH